MLCFFVCLCVVFCFVLFYLQNILLVYSAQYQQTTQSKSGQKTQADTSPTKHTDGQQTHEKILIIADY